MFATAVHPGELLTSIRIPAKGDARDGWASATLGKDGTGIVSVAATIADGNARIAIGCVAATPVVLTASADETAVADAVKSADLDPPATCMPRPTTDAISPRCSSARRCGETPRERPHDRRQRQRRALRARGRGAQAARPLHPRRPRPDRHARRLRHGQLRRLHRPPRRHGREELHAARPAGGRRGDHHRRGTGRRRGRADTAPAGLPRAPRAPVRVLHARDADERDLPALPHAAADGGGDPARDPGQHLPLHRLREHRQVDPGSVGAETQ